MARLFFTEESNLRGSPYKYHERVLRSYGYRPVRRQVSHEEWARGDHIVVLDHYDGTWIARSAGPNHEPYWAMDHNELDRVLRSMYS